MRNRGCAEIGLLYIVIFILGLLGWGMNICKLCKCDFEPSYKAEIIRSIGVFIGPVGAVAGYCDIEDGVVKEDNEKLTN